MTHFCHIIFALALRGWSKLCVLLVNCNGIWCIPAACFTIMNCCMLDINNLCVNTFDSTDMASREIMIIGGVYEKVGTTLLA